MWTLQLAENPCHPLPHGQEWLQVYDGRIYDLLHEHKESNQDWGAKDDNLGRVGKQLKLIPYSPLNNKTVGGYKLHAEHQWAEPLISEEGAMELLHASADLRHVSARKSGLRQNQPNPQASHLL